MTEDPGLQNQIAAAHQNTWMAEVELLMEPHGLWDAHQRLNTIPWLYFHPLQARGSSTCNLHCLSVGSEADSPGDQHDTSVSWSLFRATRAPSPGSAGCSSLEEPVTHLRGLVFGGRKMQPKLWLLPKENTVVGLQCVCRRKQNKTKNTKNKPFFIMLEMDGFY